MRGSCARAGRRVVCLQVPHDLQTVLHTPQEPVGVGQDLGVRVGHVSLQRQRSESSERVGGAQLDITAPVHDLQQLHRELDVADAALPRLTSVNSLPCWRMYSSSRTFVRRTSSMVAGASSGG